LPHGDMSRFLISCKASDGNEAGGDDGRPDFPPAAVKPLEMALIPAGEPHRTEVEARDR